MKIKKRYDLYLFCYIIILGFIYLIWKNKTALIIFSISSYIIFYVDIKYNLFKKLRNISNNLKKIENGNLEKGLLTYDEIKAEKIKVMNDILKSFDKMKNTILDREIELQEKNEFLKEQNKKLKEYDELKNQFLANISHELKTPLNAIIGFSELLKDEVLGSINDKQKEKLQRILTRSEELLDLINQLLEINKIVAGKVNLNKNDIYVHKIFKDLKNTFEPIVARQEVNLNFYNKDKKTKVNVDYSKIKMLFNNLISNAVKFTTEGEVNVSVEDYNNRYLLFVVEDTGIGIPKKEWEKIFNTFYQVDSSSTRMYGGSGLGLTIAKEIVDLHEGKIWLESEKGEGTSFYFLLSKANKEVAV